MWIVRDFTLRMEDKHGLKISSKEYLENALTEQWNEHFCEYSGLDQTCYHVSSEGQKVENSYDLRD